MSLFAQIKQEPVEVIYTIPPPPARIKHEPVEVLFERNAGIVVETKNTFTVQATDVNGCVGIRTYTITIQRTVT